MRRNQLPGQEDKWWQKTIALSSAQKQRGADICLLVLVHKFPLPKGRVLLKREYMFCFTESIQFLQGLEIHDRQVWFEMQSSWHYLLWSHMMI